MKCIRFVWFGLVALLALAVALILWPILLPPHRITPENVALLANGMNRAEVEQVLGAPPGDYDGAIAFWLLRDEENLKAEIKMSKFVPDAGSISWVSRWAAVALTFDDSGLVSDIQHGVIWIVQPTLLDKIRGWLKL